MQVSDSPMITKDMIRPDEVKHKYNLKIVEKNRKSFI